MMSTEHSSKTGSSRLGTKTSYLLSVRICLERFGTGLLDGLIYGQHAQGETLGRACLFQGLNILDSLCPL